MKKNIDLSIEMNSDGFFTVQVIEPESGEFNTIQNYFSPNEHPEFDREIGGEIYSWLSLWFDELGLDD